MPATHNAVFTELGSKGQADKLMLAEGPEESQETFWRHVHDKHSPFGLEPVEFDVAASQPRFNGSAKFAYPRQPDLAWHHYVHYQLPGIVGLKDGKVLRGAEAPYWHPHTGFRLTRQATLAIGGNVIDTLSDTFLYVWEALTHKAGKKLGEMIGSFESVEEQQAWSKRSQHLWVPLPFSCCREASLALPIVSLSFHQMFVELDFCSRNDAIVNPGGAQIFVRPDGMTDDEVEKNFSENSRGRIISLLQDSDLQATVEANGIYLENDERNKFGKGVFTQLVDELQVIPAQAYYAAAGATETTPSVKINPRMQFNNVVMEYITVVRREASEACVNYFDFSGPVDPASGLTLDPLREIGVRFNNTPRVATRTAKYFRLVQPYQYHTNVPKDFIYVWSYAKDPENGLQPSGGANHTRLENVNIEYHLEPRLFSPESPNAEVITFGRSKNLLTFKFGMIHKKLV